MGVLGYHHHHIIGCGLHGSWRVGWLGGGQARRAAWRVSLCVGWWAGPGLYLGGCVCRMGGRPGVPIWKRSACRLSTSVWQVNLHPPRPASPAELPPLVGVLAVRRVEKAVGANRAAFVPAGFRSRRCPGSIRLPAFYPPDTQQWYAWGVVVGRTVGPFGLP